MTQEIKLPPLPAGVIQNYPSGRWSYAADQMREYARAAVALNAPTIPADAMSAIADRYAHRMALHLECILLDYHGKWSGEAAQTLGEYRDAMNAIWEAESPTHMGEPVIEPPAGPEAA